jgi:hypothetical protein
MTLASIFGNGRGRLRLTPLFIANPIYATMISDRHRRDAEGRTDASSRASSRIAKSRKMRRYFALFALLALAGCDDSNSFCASDCVTVNSNGPMIHGSGKLKTETRQVGTFTSVQMPGSGNGTIERTGADSLSVTGDDNLLALFTSQVEDGTLYLSYAEGKSFEGKIPVYHITIADLRAIGIKGSGRIDASKLDGTALALSIAGSGRIHVAGLADALTVSLSGSGSIDASELKAKSAKVVLSGSGSAVVNASETLDVQISGSGSLRYLGSPKLTSKISGSGRIKQQQ